MPSFQKSKSRKVNTFVRLRLETQALTEAVAVNKIECDVALADLTGTQRGEAERLLKQLTEESNGR